MRKENRESGKRERGVNDDSSFRLNVSENAVSTHTVPIILEHGTPTISADIEGMSRGLILDTGSNISIMQAGISKSNVQVTTMEPYGGYPRYQGTTNSNFPDERKQVYAPLSSMFAPHHGSWSIGHRFLEVPN